MEKPKQEICTIRIMFPVATDEEAITIKQKIKEVLSDKPEAQIFFGLAAIPQKDLPNAPLV